MDIPLDLFGRMARRIGRSISYRSGPVYREILKTLPHPQVRKKNSLGIPVVTICTQNYLLLLEQLLFTIATRWSAIPNVVVVSDGPAVLSQIRRDLSWWPARLDVVEWHSFRDFHKEKGRFELVEYADKDMLGRKLSVILAMSEQSRMLWCDCDILFFSDFSSFLNASASSRPLLQTTQDAAYSYDPRLIEGGLQHLCSRPPINTGLVLCEGDLYDTCHLGELIKQGIPNCMLYTEQTILAESVFQLGKIGWDQDVVRIFDHDEHNVGPTYLGKHWVARHYVGPIRFFFWRDALALRLGVGESL
jgi:hypothetical protein